MFIHNLNNRRLTDRRASRRPSSKHYHGRSSQEDGHGYEHRRSVAGGGTHSRLAVAHVGSVHRDDSRRPTVQGYGAVAHGGSVAHNAAGDPLPPQTHGGHHAGGHGGGAGGGGGHRATARRRTTALTGRFAKGFEALTKRRSKEKDKERAKEAAARLPQHRASMPAQDLYRASPPVAPRPARIDGGGVLAAGPGRRASAPARDGSAAVSKRRRSSAYLYARAQQGGARPRRGSKNIPMNAGLGFGIDPPLGDPHAMEQWFMFQQQARAGVPRSPHSRALMMAAPAAMHMNASRAPSHNDASRASNVFGGSPTHAMSQDMEALQAAELTCFPPTPSPAAAVYTIFDDPGSSMAARYVSVFIMATIVMSSTTFVLESLPQFRKRADRGEEPLPVFEYIELVSIVIFTVEYLARLLTCHAVPRAQLGMPEESVTLAFDEDGNGEHVTFVDVNKNNVATGATNGVFHLPRRSTVRRMTNPAVPAALAISRVADDQRSDSGNSDDFTGNDGNSDLDAAHERSPGGGATGHRTEAEMVAASSKAVAGSRVVSQDAPLVAMHGLSEERDDAPGPDDGADVDADDAADDMVEAIASEAGVDADADEGHAQAIDSKPAATTNMKLRSKRAKRRSSNRGNLPDTSGRRHVNEVPRTARVTLMGGTDSDGMPPPPLVSSLDPAKHVPGWESPRGRRRTSLPGVMARESIAEEYVTFDADAAAASSETPGDVSGDSKEPDGGGRGDGDHGGAGTPEGEAVVVARAETARAVGEALGAAASAAQSSRDHDGGGLDGPAVPSSSPDATRGVSTGGAPVSGATAAALIVDTSLAEDGVASESKSPVITVTLPSDPTQPAGSTYTAAVMAAADGAAKNEDGYSDTRRSVSSGQPPRRGSWRKVLFFLRTPMNLLDLAAILPFYAELLLQSGGQASGLAVLRILRLARVFRVFKLGKYSQGMRLMMRVVSASAQAMYLLLFWILLGMVVFGSIVFFAEEGTYDPDTDTYLRPNIRGTGLEESPFTSIPASFYWVLVTATTVGYGDYYPTTVAGKAVAIVCMHAGILVLALPITVIGANFAVEYADAEEAQYDGEDDDVDGAASYARSIAGASPDLQQHSVPVLDDPRGGGVLSPVASFDDDGNGGNDDVRSELASIKGEIAALRELMVASLAPARQEGLAAASPLAASSSLSSGESSAPRGLVPAVALDVDASAGSAVAAVARG